MKLLKATFAAIALLTVASAGVAQAPIVREPPPAQQPDQQPGQQPQYSAPPADPQAQPQYPQPGNSQTYPQQDQQQSQPPDPAAQQQAGQAPPPPLPPQQLDAVVNRIALYPDPLLAQVLTAATYWDEIPGAAGWAKEHSFLHGDALSAAITADNLPWDASVLALLPFPSVLDMMASDPDWTGQLGNAVLVQRDQVMDAIQQLRQQAYSYGYLASNSDVDVVDGGGYIQIQPFNPYLYYVPVYDPFVVFAPPRPGLFVGGAVRFGPAVTLGASFGRFGWFGAGFGWGAHTLLIDHRPWARTYANRAAYVHPYAHPYVRPAAPRVERHQQQSNRGSSDRQH